MTKDYKIFFGNRKIVLTNNLKRNFLDHSGYYVGFDSNTEMANLLQFFQNLKSIDSLYIIGTDVEAIFKEFARQVKIIEAAGGLVYNGNNSYLLMKSNGLWDLPKGKVEEGEKIEQAAQREVIEECGLETVKLENHLVDTFHTYELNGKKILKKTSWFKMYSENSDNLKPQVEENITEACWVPKNEISKFISNTYFSLADVFHSSGLI